MKGLFPTYAEFSRYNDRYMLKHRKQRNPTVLKVVYYVFMLIAWALFLLTVALIIGGIRKGSKRNYRTSDKYRKVIKEGVFFDTIEYHER